MTNIDIFLVEKEIVESLLNKETAKCLSWCNENKSKLKKINVNFFRLLINLKEKLKFFLDSRVIWSFLFDNKNSLN